MNNRTDQLDNLRVIAKCRQKLFLDVIIILPVVRRSRRARPRRRRSCSWTRATPGPPASAQSPPTIKVDIHEKCQIVRKPSIQGGTGLNPHGLNRPDKTPVKTLWIQTDLWKPCQNPVKTKLIITSEMGNQSLQNNKKCFTSVGDEHFYSETCSKQPQEYFHEFSGRSKILKKSFDGRIWTCDI